jgi:hypothetical protein
VFEKARKSPVLPTSCALLTFLMYVQDVGCGNRDEYHDDCKQDPPGYGRTRSFQTIQEVAKRKCDFRERVDGRQEELLQKSSNAAFDNAARSTT